MLYELLRYFLVFESHTICTYVCNYKSIGSYLFISRAMLDQSFGAHPYSHKQFSFRREDVSLQLHRIPGMYV
jgi:hypothetical protein